MAQTGSTVQLTGLSLQGAIIQGGSLSTVGTGVINATGGTLDGSTLGPLTVAGTLSVLNSGTLTVKGSIINTGSFQLNAGNNYTELEVSQSATLTGTYVMSDSAFNTITGLSTGTETLTNQGVIQGAGLIGYNPSQQLGFLTLVNQGTINAVSTHHKALEIQPGTGGVTNTGTMEATAGGTLHLTGSIANTGGTILATGSGAQVLLDGSTLSGGTLTSTAAGLLIGENSATLDGSTHSVTISTGSSLQVNNGQTIQALGAITDNGTLSLNSSGANTQLVLTGNTTLSGTGKVTLANKSTNVITATATTDVLTNSITIQGSGNIGNGAMGLVNTKAITANQSTALIIDTSSAGFNNTGTLTVNSGDTAADHRRDLPESLGQHADRRHLRRHRNNAVQQHRRHHHQRLQHYVDGGQAPKSSTRTVTTP